MSEEKKLEKKISIILPVYNAEEYLVECLDSICGQTHKNLEVLCIDGNSTDNSCKILSEYSQRDIRIKIFQKENEGVSLSRNYGLNHATGDYIMFVDADDWIEKTTCQKAITEAENTKADVIMWSYTREFGNTSLPKKILDYDRYEFEENEVKEKLHRRYIGLLGGELVHVESADSLCPVWGKLYKREIIKHHNIRFIDIRKIGTYEDGLFNLEVMQYVKKAVYLQQYWYHYRKDNQNSITSRYKPHLYKQWKQLFRYMKNYIEKNNLGPEYEIARKNRICLSVLGQGLNLMESDYDFRKKRRYIKRLLTSDIYKEAFRQLDFQYFPMHWKVFYRLAKDQNAAGVLILLEIIHKKIGTV